MKKAMCLCLSAGLVFASSAIIFGMASKQANALETKADPVANTTIYLDLNQTNWYWKENATIQVNYWGGSSYSGDPGLTMQENEYHLFYAEIPSDTTTLYFRVNGWGGDCKTEDLTFDSTKTLWTITTSYTNGTSQKASCEPYVGPKTIYVLDKTGDLLTSAGAHVHFWRNSSSFVKSTWSDADHGDKMSVYHGNIYSVTVPGYMTSLLFNNNSSSQTADLSIGGECSVLENNWDGSKWTTLHAASFVDGFMKFDSIDVSNGDKGIACKANWSDLYSEYTSYTSEQQGDIIAVKDVANRLSEWAQANGSTFNKSTGALSSLPTVSFDSNQFQPVNGASIYIAIIAGIAVAGATGFLTLRKRKQN